MLNYSSLCLFLSSVVSSATERYFFQYCFLNRYKKESILALTRLERSQKITKECTVLVHIRSSVPVTSIYIRNSKTLAHFILYLLYCTFPTDSRLRILNFLYTEKVKKTRLNMRCNKRCKKNFPSAFTLI